MQKAAMKYFISIRFARRSLSEAGRYLVNGIKKGGGIQVYQIPSSYINKNILNIIVSICADDSCHRLLHHQRFLNHHYCRRMTDYKCDLVVYCNLWTACYNLAWQTHYLQYYNYCGSFANKNKV